jgi:glycosyltransferase involved in cell wall biosynthesis
MPRVSVIIPCYNHAHYLPDAVNSVLTQTFTDWEVIIVDDGSTDNTREVAAQFTDPRIRYIYQENRGLSGARSTGIHAAEGELIALLDADDMWEPTFLEMMITALQAEPAASAAYCGFCWMDTDGNLLKQAVSKVVAPDQFREELLYHGSWLSACAIVVRASAYREIGPFDETLRACEDLDMWLRLSQKHRFVSVPQVLVRYRRAGNNMSDDVERMSEAFTLLIEKHFGDMLEPVETWSSQKRAVVGRLYSSRAFGHLAQGDVVKSVENIGWMLNHDPDTFLSLDLWYSLACVHQAIGQRGDFDTWNPVKGEADVLAVLGEFTRQGLQSRLLNKARSMVYLALACLNYGKQDIRVARKHLYRSGYFWPGMITYKRWRTLFLRLVPFVPALKRFVTRLRHGGEEC